jgi:hypothetical protein
MGNEKVDVLYDDKGQAIRVQMDFDLYEWLLEQVPSSMKENVALAS